MPDYNTPRWSGGEWDGQCAPVLAAARDTLEAVSFDPIAVAVQVEWETKRSDWDELDAAARALDHLDEPVAIYVLITEGVMAGQSDTPVGLIIAARDRTVAVNASGRDWARTDSAFQAARRVMRDAYGERDDGRATRSSEAATQEIERPELAQSGLVRAEPPGSMPHPNAPSPGTGFWVGARFIPWTPVAITVSLIIAIAGWVFFG